ncbi:MAG TPA: hypothetical protein VKA70_01725 [Blastocatellia bacterium]|nr:hypothetical protein [Blastocatellia bacterium]
MNERARPAWQSILTFLGVMLVIIAALIMAIGIYKWPDAPIRETAGGYVGKTGKAHTREDYELFNIWLKALFISFPLAFAVNFIAVIANRRRKKESIPS